MNSEMELAGKSLPTVTTKGLEATIEIGSKSLVVKLTLRGEWRKRQQCYGCEEQRVAVRLCARRVGGSDDAARAGFILNDEGLFECSLKMFGGQASQNVGNSAGRVRHDQRNRPVRPTGIRGRA